MSEDDRSRAKRIAARLYSLYSKDILAFFRCTYRMSADDAGDLLQHTFEGLLRTLEHNPDTELGNPRAYLFRIARWKVAEVRKRARSRPNLVGEEAAQEPASQEEADDLEYLAAMRSDQRLLLRSMRRLTDDDNARADAEVDGGPAPEERGGSEQQLLLYLRYWAGLTLAEVADVFEIPQGTASGRIRRALTLLRRRVDELKGMDAAAHHTSTTVLQRWQDALEHEAEQRVPAADDG